MTQQKETAEKLFDMFPFVDIVFGTHNLYELPSMVEDRLIENQRVFAVADGGGDIPEGLPIGRAGNPLASVNIMYGCDNYCSYCIVPYVRGRERSGCIENNREIGILAGQGYKEVMLLGRM